MWNGLITEWTQTNLSKINLSQMFFTLFFQSDQWNSIYRYVQKVFNAHILLFFRALPALNMQAKRSIGFYFAEYVLVCSRILPGTLLVMTHIRISSIIRPALGRKKQSCIRTRKHTYVLMYVLIHTYYKVHASSWFMECRESRARGSLCVQLVCIKHQNC